MVEATSDISKGAFILLNPDEFYIRSSSYEGSYESPPISSSFMALFSFYVIEALFLAAL